LKIISTGLTLFLDFDGYIHSSLEKSPYEVEQSNTNSLEICWLISLALVLNQFSSLPKSRANTYTGHGVSRYS